MVCDFRYPRRGVWLLNPCKMNVVLNVGERKGTSCRTWRCIMELFFFSNLQEEMQVWSGAGRDNYIYYYYYYYCNQHL